jgi:hypothetical protein
MWPLLFQYDTAGISSKVRILSLVTLGHTYVGFAADQSGSETPMERAPAAADPPGRPGPGAKIPDGKGSSGAGQPEIKRIANAADTASAIFQHVLNIFKSSTY